MVYTVHSSPHKCRKILFLTVASFSLQFQDRDHNSMSSKQVTYMLLLDLKLYFLLYYHGA